jgi:hypothetical protein
MTKKDMSGLCDSLFPAMLCSGLRFLSASARTMDAEESVSGLSSGDESEQFCNDASQSINSLRGLRLPQQSLRRPPRQALPFVPYEDWIPGQLYNDLPPSCMHYIMEWKLTLNRRVAAKQTEDDLVVAPSDFWNEELSTKLANIVQSTGKPCEADATTIVISVNDRSEHDITKRFEKLDIDWSIVERQLQAWSHLLPIGKKLRINVSFNYIESKAARTAGRGATAAQLAERSDRLDAEQAVLDRPAAWRHVYSLLRCPGAPCDRGPHCWQDSADGHKHYRLLTHHLRNLVKFVQRGGTLDSHDDIPQEIRTELYAEAQQHLSRKRKRRDSGSSLTGHPIVVNNYIPAHPSLQ